MRTAVEVFARRLWSGEMGAAGALLTGAATPISWAWAGLSAAVGAQRARRAVGVEGLTVVSVGNLAVGGTGKTPLADWIARRAMEWEHHPAILVADVARDEAALHGRRLPGVAVLRATDRVGSAERARHDGASVAVLDDGFQHRRLRRDLDVVLLAAEDRFPGRPLPAGPYREGPGALERADVILVTRRRATAAAARTLAERVARHAPEGAIGCFELAPEGWLRLDGGPCAAPETDVVAVCAIARPESFRSAVALRVRGAVELVAFPDHHEYTPGDIDEVRKLRLGRPLVTTEKDAVKLNAYAGTLGEAYVLVEKIRWDWGERAFELRLRACLDRAG